MTDYPLPRHAAHIWLAGDTLCLGFPPLAGHEKGHTIQVPCTDKGLLRALAILQDRAKAADLRLNQRGTPTQLNLESDAKYKAWLKSLETTKEERESAGAFLAGLGL